MRRMGSSPIRGTKCRGSSEEEQLNHNQQVGIAKFPLGTLNHVDKFQRMTKSVYSKVGRNFRKVEILCSTQGVGLISG